MPEYSSEQILALAPDAASAKAGQGLATPRKWQGLGKTELVVWGECQGSGKEPYRTQVDLSEPAFKCSCPSHKFPCKHGLGLFLLLASQPVLFTGSEPPEWVTQWLETRAKRAEKQAAPRQETSPDPKAQAKRLEQREKKVAAGMADLELWLRDLVRRGLGTAQEQPYSFWETAAARLVDAQAPGVARMVRELAGIPPSGAGWQERLLEKLSRLHLLLEGYKRCADLPTEIQADIRSLLGWTQNQDELLAGNGARDEWLVLGRSVEDEGRFRVQRTWLWGVGQARPALVLSFAAAGQNFDVSLVPGTRLDAELVFYPGNYPLRALVKERYAPAEPLSVVPGYASMTGATAAFAAALSRNPWLEQFPVVLQDVHPMRGSGQWSVRDQAGHTLPLAPRYADGWRLLALGGGHPLTLFGEWNGDFLLPLNAWAQSESSDRVEYSEVP